MLYHVARLKLEGFKGLKIYLSANEILVEISLAEGETVSAEKERRGGMKFVIFYEKVR